ncbi:MAG: hypothetical protein QOE05_3447 [Actinomycetota bacterium]|jgi:hypothetical protein|nr:hypothetical protein [Actinomycetota bacterium]
MTARPRRTTTLVGPNRIVLGAATAGLVALASAGTALLVLTGTSSVAPVAAPAPPLPTSTPLTRAPGVVVLPSDDAGRLTGSHAPQPARRGPVFRTPAAPQVVPAVLAFTDEPPPAVPPVAVPPVAVPPVAVPVQPVPVLPALQRAPVTGEVEPAHPGRQLAKGHAKAHAKGHAKGHAKAAKHHRKHHAKKAKLHGKRVGWAQSQHLGNR